MFHCFGLTFIFLRVLRVLQLDGDVGVQRQELLLLQLVLESVEAVREVPPARGLQYLDPLLVDRLLLVLDQVV